MKIALVVLGLAALTFLDASAQVAVEVTTDQLEFLPSETMAVAVRITNRSGQPLHLGADPHWLTFTVESGDGFIVVKNGEVPVLGEFDLGSSQVATKRVNIESYFGLMRPGRYRVIATVRIPDWNDAISSPAKELYVINGAKIWAQNFGMPLAADATNRTPEVRRYTLEKANYLRTQLRLYVQVSDPAEARVFKVVSIGKTVSFSDPEMQLDRASNLHVLFQSGAALFTYAVVNPDGGLMKQEVFDYISKRPHLDVNADGSVLVAGGVRRLSPHEMPMVKSPDQLPSIPP
ncbi:MAG: hypothetical protein WDM80_12850 [Limisphaerales bacterium]